MNLDKFVAMSGRGRSASHYDVARRARAAPIPPTNAPTTHRALANPTPHARRRPTTGKPQPRTDRLKGTGRREGNGAAIPGGVLAARPPTVTSWKLSRGRPHMGTHRTPLGVPTRKQLDATRKR